MTVKGLKLSQAEVSQEFDLNEILGVDVKDDEGLAEAVGQYLIDRIVDRTSSGKDVNGKSMPKYSKTYKESLEYKAWGKTGKVNMELSGEMLTSLDILSIKNGKIKIGWNDGENSVKAYGNITGMEGHPYLDGIAPKREFFGVTAAEIKSIAKEFKPTTRAADEDNDQEIIKRLAKLMGA